MNTPIDLDRVRLEWMTTSLAGTVLELQRSEEFAPSFPTGAERRLAEALLRPGSRPSRYPFGAFVVRCVETGLLIGSAGFHGEPLSRSVEIGYGVVQSWRGRGIASEVVLGLVAVARRTGEVDALTATVDQQNLASAAVLRRCGFGPVESQPTIWSLDLS